ncbi:hypothetical protein [Roseixanthobacter pseudopolyaromaticivorans]|uniref:hypothetical protein n=1 Tax=Xanthobacteraceae TaxID=335928 RepID=UPI00372BB5CA
MRLGLSLPSAALYRQRGQPLAPETTSLLARMSVQPAAGRRTQIDTLVKSLLAAGIWTKLDALYLLAAHDAQAARLNLVPWSGPVTNTLVNSEFAGAAAGAVPAGLSLAGFAAGSGSNYEIQGVDIVNGRRYLRLRLYGTSVVVNPITISLRSDTNVEVGQRWTSSASVELVSGTWVSGLSAVTLRLNGESGGANFTPGALAQYSNTRVATVASTGSNIVLRFSTPNAATTPVSYDVVLRIGMPQLVQMDVPGAYIPTSTGTAAQVQTLSRFDLSAVNSPLFTTDRGFTGNGTTSYLDTNANPSFDFSKVALNSAAYGVWVASATTSANSTIGATVSLVPVVSRSDADTAYCRVHTTSSLVATGVTTSIGLTAGNRSAANAIQLYRNGMSIAASAAASSAMPTELWVGRNVGTYYPGQIAVVFAGASLSGGEHLALHSALRIYLMAVGAAS